MKQSPPERALFWVRRSLSQSQRALIAAGFVEYEREQARARMSEGLTLPPNFVPHNRGHGVACLA